MTSRFCWGMLVAAAASLCLMPPARADTITNDTSIIIHDPSPGETPVPVGFIFDFFSNSSGSLVDTPTFENATDALWFNLLITTVLPEGFKPVGGLNCSQAPGTTFFAGCDLTTQTLTNGETLVSIFYSGTGNGIPSGASFYFTGGGWASDEVFVANANFVPEPADYLLLLTGLAVLAGWYLTARKETKVKALSARPS